MIHFHDGLSFGRLPNGSVVIVKTENSGGVDIELFRTVIDPNGWASLIASVSLGGEGQGRFYAAQKFHNTVGEVNLLAASYDP